MGYAPENVFRRKRRPYVGRVGGNVQLVPDSCNSGPEHAISADPPTRARGLESAVGLDATVLAILIDAQ